MWTRREMLSRSGLGLGMLGLTDLLRGESARAESTATHPLAPKPPHFAAKARRVIHLFLNGGVSHVDTFDPKPILDKHHGQPLPTSQRTERKTGAAFRSPFKFAKHGRNGIDVSELFPNIAASIDDVCVIRSMYADVPNHEPSYLLMNCGDGRQARPSMGAWVTYGLGTENQNLPGFVVMCPGGYPATAGQNWRSAFLPGAFQGTYIDTQHTQPEKLIENIRNDFLLPGRQREQLDLLRQINGRHLSRRPGDAQLEARIQSFELAYRMQSEATDAFDVTREPQAAREMYGDTTYGRQLLIARRLLERGVRFVQVWQRAGQPWDAHDNLETNHRDLAKECDQPIAALLRDLKQLGMLDSTLVIIGGEFGRTPTVEIPTPGVSRTPNGRDHNHYGFSMCLAGGGVKPGYVHGATDELGWNAVEGRVHIHDLHATILHLLGFDHEQLTYRYAGRDFRLTDVHGEVVRDVLA
ncbi:MAG: DUF1501 domain-containing protein [Planctomycetota bacterium]|nr:MAG: DUF1501 domain-containing protein [Planctomycetota bacterium]GDY06893.1 hypothetical protein LBMAG52_03790 [Planctomycetia bacterium]